MTGTDPITAIVDQLAAHAEQLTRLDTRHADHHAAVSARLAELTGQTAALGHVVEEHAAALTRLTAPSQTGPDGDGYCPNQHRRGGSWRPTTGRNPSPGCGPGSSRSTGPATATWPPPSAPAGPPTTCACTGWTSPPSCGRCCTCSPPAAPPCCPPRPNTRPASCPPWPTSSASRPTPAATPATPHRPTASPGARHDRRDAPPGPGLRRPRLAGAALPARPEDPGHPARRPRRHHRPRADHRLVRPPPRLEPRDRHRRPRPRRPGRRPARRRRERVRRLPPAARRPGCWTGPAPTCAPPAAGCTPTSPAPASATATCPPITWTSAPTAAMSSPRPPRSTASPTSWSRPSAAAAPWTGTPSSATCNPSASPHRRRHPQPGRQDLSGLARWVASQAEGNRNAGLFWAANRALDADPAADLSPLAAAARHAGLGEREITRTLDSARKGGRTRTPAPDHQAEAGEI